MNIRKAIKRRLMALKASRYYLKQLHNGKEVLFKELSGSTLPPLRFRNGITWHHGNFDEPLLLFRELFIENLLPSIENAPQGSQVIDIGANIGAATLYWFGERKDLKFHCYEPNPQAFATLSTNMQANIGANAKAYAVAVGGSHGELELWIDIPTAHSTSFGDSPMPNGRKVTVPCIPLSEVIDKVGENVYLLKVDTEGAEGEILQSVDPSLLRKCENILVEWHDNIVPDVSRIVRTVLDNAGFKVLAELHHPWDEGIIHAARC